jgi:endogenous inhibitor of DNA gyrase (YacG/DUF329 family)
MKTKTTRTVEEKIVVTTCDSCGKEIGRNHRGDYNGYCCSMCGRQFCHECHKKVTVHDEELYAYICPECVKVDNGTSDRMKEIDAAQRAAMDERYALQEAWKKRSNPSAGDDV